MSTCKVLQSVIIALMGKGFSKLVLKRLRKTSRAHQLYWASSSRLLHFLETYYLTHFCFNASIFDELKNGKKSGFHHWPHWQVYEETFFGCPEQLNRWHARKVVSVVINFLNMKIEIETNIWTKVRWEFIYKLFAQLNWLLFASFCICICQFHDK